MTKNTFYSYIYICTSPVINCTSLISPVGPLRISSCGNHFGAKCNFSCTIGYRLNGSSTVTCVAPGKRPPGLWDSPLPSCQGEKYIIYTGFEKLNSVYVYSNSTEIKQYQRSSRIISVFHSHSYHVLSPTSLSKAIISQIRHIRI